MATTVRGWAGVIDGSTGTRLLTLVASAAGAPSGGRMQFIGCWNPARINGCSCLVATRSAPDGLPLHPERPLCRAGRKPGGQLTLWGLYRMFES